MQQVQLGQAAACVTTAAALAMVAPELSAGLRAVGQTADLPGVVFVAHQRVPEAMRERLAAELIGLKRGDEGRRMLHGMGLGELGTVDVKAYEALAGGGRC